MTHPNIAHPFFYKILSLTLAIFFVISPVMILSAEEAATSSDPVAEATVGTEGGAEVATGDAAAQTNIINDANTNTDTVEGETGATTTNATTTATSTEPAEEVAIDHSSTTTIDNTATTTAGTGENTASSTGTSTVTTGDAYAGANVVNLANTNIINSNWLLLFLSNLFGGIGNVDIREYFNQMNALMGFSGDINTSSEASIFNNLYVQAGTGGNHASGTSANISTGDAFAEANVVNIANSNIINSNYLLMVFNNVGDWNGDLVLPGQDFFSQLFFGGSSASLDANSQADIGNNVGVGADSGGNSATSSDGDAFIATGDANAGANVYNQANSNFVGTDSFVLLFRIHGNWSGDVLNMPAGFSFARTPFGLQVVGGQTVSSPDGVLSELGSDDDLEVSAVSSSNALVRNNVQVYAITGNNQAEGDDVSIQTGNAYAVANIVNVVNTNVIGRNWMLAIINIFGNWTGNLSFGLPNLWVGGRAESPSTIGPGTAVTYHVTVANRGDAPMSDVKVNLSFDSDLIAAQGATEKYIAKIAPGGVEEITFNAIVSEDLPRGSTELTAKITALGKERDANKDDNTDIVTVTAMNKRGGGGGNSNRAGSGGGSDLTISKSAAAALTTASSTVDYTITIENGDTKITGAVLTDELKNTSGQLVTKQEWQLGDIEPREKIIVNYTALFASSTAAGVYTNYAQVLSANATSSVASVMVTVINNTPVNVPVVTASTGGGAITMSNPKVERIPLTEATEEGEEEVAITNAFIDNNSPRAAGFLANIFNALKDAWPGLLAILALLSAAGIAYIVWGNLKDRSEEADYWELYH